MLSSLAGAWSAFCGEESTTSPSCSSSSPAVGCGVQASSSSLKCIRDGSSIFINVMLLVVFVANFIIRGCSRWKLPTNTTVFQRNSHKKLYCGGIYSVILGLCYVAVGLWNFQEMILGMGQITPLHGWVVYLFQGSIWELLGLILLIRPTRVSGAFLNSWSVVACLFSFIFSVAYILMSAANKISIPSIVTLELFSLPGALLVLYFTTAKNDATEKPSWIDSSDLCTPLNAQTDHFDTGAAENVASFANASLFSKLSFWWLDPLLKKGRESPLEEKDMPKLGKEDGAERLYETFSNKLKQMEKNSHSQSIFWALVLCHQREILVSGFFALLKILTLSSGPMLLNVFIKVAEGHESFSNEGYVLAAALFSAKVLESISQRQWYFRTRRIGLQVRSTLLASIYHKHLRLSNEAKMKHSTGEIMNYVNIDAYRVGEFPFWFHQTWTTSLQLSFVIAILFNVVGVATISALVVIILTVMCNTPLAKLQHKFHSKLMGAQDTRLKAVSESLMSMKVLKLYAWEANFKLIIEGLRKIEEKWLVAFQLRKAYNSCLFWSAPVLVSSSTFITCYFLGTPLRASNVFTFIATLRLVQDPVRTIPDIVGVVIQAKVAFAQIVNFLEAPELLAEHTERDSSRWQSEYRISIKSANLGWTGNLSAPNLRNINLMIKQGQKVAICGEVGSGKSTLLAAVLGELPLLEGSLQVFGTIAYVSQTAWIQSGTIRENILFGSPLNEKEYQEVIDKCSLSKDLEMFPFGDLTQIGERGVNLSGGQKQRIQLARAVYQDADIYLLDDPFSAVDAHTSGRLFHECVMEALSEKTVLLVTHQVDFLPAFNSVMLMSQGEIICGAPYHELLISSPEFQALVNEHKDTIDSNNFTHFSSQNSFTIREENKSKVYLDEDLKETVPLGDQLIKEEKERGDVGFRPYLQYLSLNKGIWYFSFAVLAHCFVLGAQILQNSWMAANVQRPDLSTLWLISVYSIIGFGSVFFIFVRSLFIVTLCLQTSKALFSQLMTSLFFAPISFYDSTPLGRIMSRISSDLNIVDLDIPFSLTLSVSTTINAYCNLGVLALITWPILFVSIPMVYLSIKVQRYYFATAKELMRINGTTKSVVANHLAESMSGAMIIRAFKEEGRFFEKTLELIDNNASPFFHNFAATEWLIQRLETLCAAVLSSTALVMVMLPSRTFSVGFIGMAMSYALSLNMSLVLSIQNQCTLANYIVSMERINQYMHVPSEAPQVVEGSRPSFSWPSVGKVEIHDLKIRYRPDTPLVLQGVTCTFEGGHKIGIVGRTGSGKTTLIGALFRLVEPCWGKIVIDDLDISTIGLNDLRSRLGIIPQDPTLLRGSVRYNLDPLQKHSDQEIWEVLGKCQLRETVQEKKDGLDSLVVEDGSNWSMGQRQLFCLGRAILRKSKILVLDEATASIDNATDAILQKTIRSEFSDCTVITVAHRIPTVMDCTMVMAISDGKLVEFDKPTNLMEENGSLFRKLVNEYWSHASTAAAAMNTKESFR